VAAWCGSQDGRWHGSTPALIGTDREPYSIGMIGVAIVRSLLLVLELESLGADCSRAVAQKSRLRLSLQRLHTPGTSCGFPLGGPSLLPPLRLADLTRGRTRQLPCDCVEPLANIAGQEVTLCGVTLQWCGALCGSLTTQE
jgi:hypothetical protein